MTRKLRAIRLMASFIFRADRRLAWVSVVLTPLMSASLPATALGVKLLVDGASEQSSHKLSWGAAALSAAVCMRWAFEWLFVRVMTALAERTGRYGDEQIMTTVGSLPGLEHHERPQYLDMLELVRTDRDWYMSAVGLLIGGLAEATVIIATLALLAAISPVLLLLPVFGVPSLLISLRTQRRLETVQMESAAPRRLANQLFALVVKPGPAKEIRIFNVGDAIFGRFTAEVRRAQVLLVNHMRYEARWSTLGQATFGVGFLCAILFVAWRVATGTGVPGDILLVILLAQQTSRQVESAWTHLRWGRQNLVAVERFMSLTDYAEQSAVKVPSDPAPVPNTLGEGVVFDNVSFAYPGTDVPILMGLNVEIPRGTTVALVGENGAGKTTLVKLLCRFYEPTSGRITVDGADLSSIDPTQWRSRIAAGFQDFCQLEFLLSESVGVGALDFSDDFPTVERAMERAGATDVISGLPKGLETPLGRDWDGVDLSVGQWQKVALSRAMMREQPLVLILDEPTASLDAEAEFKLFERFHEAVRSSEEAGSITVLVSHRFSTVRMADLILVLESGRIREAGSHQELIRSGGLYAELYSIQARAYID